MSPSPVNTPVGHYFVGQICQHCSLTTTKRRCPVCQRKTTPYRLEKIAPDLAESDTGQGYAIWPFERLDTTHRYTGPRRPPQPRPTK